ncbi:unnamed protein product, partial [Phaeothamnion confervicola]
LTPLEAWGHLHRVVENVNALTASLVAARDMAAQNVPLAAAAPALVMTTPGGGSSGGAAAAAAADGKDDEYLTAEGQWTFRPECGDVVFASALDGWGFGLGQFARLWAKRLGCPPRRLRAMLWGDFVLNPKTMKVTRRNAAAAAGGGGGGGGGGSGGAPPMFATMILEPIWQLYDVAMRQNNAERAGRMAAKLGVEVPPRELKHSDGRAILQSVMRRWLPVAESLLRMVVEHGPSPLQAQAHRLEALWPGADVDAIAAAAAAAAAAAIADAAAVQDNAEAMASVQEAVASCDTSPEAPVVVFVSKMVAVKRSELLDRNGRPWISSSAMANGGESGTGGGATAASENGGGSGMGQELAFVAFARIFSGTLRPNTRLHVLGPKYHPLRSHCERHVRGSIGGNVSSSGGGDGGSNGGGDGSSGGGGSNGGGGLALFMMMGAGLHPVEAVPAGNVLAMAGLEGLVQKCATLSSTLACPALQALSFQARPMVRVAVEAVRQRDMAALERGLGMLYQADPAAEVMITDRGEHIISCLGELHLEQCLKDLRERYARVEFTASPPLVSFRETVLLPAPV